MLSHDNIVYTAKQNLNFFKITFGEGRGLSYLPQSHMAGMMLDQFICMANGSLCCFADKFAIQKGKSGFLFDCLKKSTGCPQKNTS